MARTYIHGGSGRIVTIERSSESSSQDRPKLVKTTEGYTDKPLSSSELKTITKKSRSSSGGSKTVSVQASPSQKELPELIPTKTPEPSIKLTEADANKPTSLRADTQAYIKSQMDTTGQTPSVQPQQYFFEAEKPSFTPAIHSESFKAEREVSMSSYEPTPLKEKVKNYLAEGIGFLNIEAEKKSKKAEIRSLGSGGATAWASSFVIAAGSQPAKAVQNPWNYFVEGTAELVGSPVKTISYVASNLKNPQVAGDLVGSAFVFKATTGGIKSGYKVVSEKVGYVRDTIVDNRYTSKFNAENIDKSYSFQPTETLLYGQSQLTPKPRVQIIGDTRAGASSSKLGETKVPSEVATETQLRFKASNQYFNQYESYQGSELKPKLAPTTETFIPESGEVISRKLPTISQEIGIGRAIETKFARERIVSEKQTTLPEPSVKPYFMLEFKSSGKNVKIAAKKGFFYSDNSRLYVSPVPGADLLIEGIERGVSSITERIDAGRTKVEAKPRLEQPSNIPSSRTGFYSPSLFYGDLNTPETNYLSRTRLTPEVSSKGKTFITSIEETGMNIDNINIQEQNNLLRQDSFQETISDTRQRQSGRIIQEQTLIQEQTPIQDNIIDNKIISIQEPIIKQVPENKKFRDYNFINEKPIPRELFISSFKTAQDEIKREKGFNVFIRRGGEFKQANPQSLSRQDALNFGTFKVGSTLSATFFLKESETAPSGSFSSKGNLKDFYQKGKLFIEKREKRLSSKSETQEIQFAGMFSKKKGFKGLFGGKRK